MTGPGDPVGEPTVRALWVAAIKQAVLTAPDRVPGGRRLVTEVTRVELIDRSLAIGAQGLLALLPFLVVVAAFTPPAVSAALIVSLERAMGLGPESLAAVTDVTVDNVRVSVDTGVFGVVIAAVSATSFSRALQRMYARVFDLAGERVPGRYKASGEWLLGWMVYIAALSLLTRWSASEPRWPWLFLVVSLGVHTAFWWWSAYRMLLRRLSWSFLFPAAMLTAVGIVLMRFGSSLVMPSYARSAVEQFSSFGLVLVAATWLVAFGGLLIVACLTGKVIAEQEWYQGLVDRSAAFRARARA